jgi:DNA-directed RNA polymerase subunit RPC12/RpoP
VAGVVKNLGYPSARYDFNKIRPPKGANNPIEFNDVECPECGYSTQPRHCKREVITEKHFVTKRTICPYCNAIIDEKVEDTKVIERMRLVKDITNTKKVSDKKVGKWVEKLRVHAGYKAGWTNYVAKAYNSDPEVQEELKILYNKFKAKMIKETTAITHIKKLTRD